MKNCVILANGKRPSKKVISYIIKKNQSTLICADGGANAAFRLGLIPEFIIGDLDSIHKRTIKHFQNKSKIVKLNRQNDTDVEKCLKLAVRLKFKEAFLLGVTGDRLDHSFCNLGIALKFNNKIKIKIIAENSLLAVISDLQVLETYPGEIISIYGIDSKTKISTKGLKYPIKNSALPFGKRESTSNEALGNFIEIKVMGGAAFIIRDFHAMKKHGFI